MTAAEKVIEWTIAAEGVFSDHAWDPGGETLFGIARNRHPLWYARVLAEPTRELRIATAKQFYAQEFWYELRCDKLNSLYVAAELFDSAVNCGPGRGVRFAQQAANLVSAQAGGWSVAEDGAIGPKTIEALNKLSVKYELQLVMAMNGFQFAYYWNELYQQNPARWKNAIAGWMQRLVVSPALILKYRPEFAK